MQPGSNSAIVCSRLFVCVLAAAAVTLAGCGGTAMLKEPQPLVSSRPLAEAKDDRIFALIDTVIIRNGPGAWARDAEWDEYLIRIRSLSDEPVEVREIVIFDALDQRIEPRSNRAELVAGTREIERRYQQSGKLVTSGEVDGLVVGMRVVGASGLVGTAAGVSALSTGSVAGAAGAVTALTVFAGAGVVLAGAGVVRLVNNAEVNRAIMRCHTMLPLTVPRGAEASLDLFFPVTPLSRRTQVVYADRHGEHRLDIDTRQALIDLDAPPAVVTRISPKFP